MVIILVAAAAGISAQTKKKVIFVYSINSRADKKLEDIVISNIKLSVVENGSLQYNIAGMDDLKLRFAQKELSRITAGTDEPLLSSAAEMSRADEIICSRIIKEHNAIRLNFTHVVISKNGKAVIKNTVTTDLYPSSQIEWYSMQAARKILKPSYVIKAPEKQDLYAKGISFTPLILNLGVVLDSTVYLYETEDTFLAGILPDIRTKMKKGDSLYLKGDFKSAFKSYKSLLQQLEKDIPEQKRNEETDLILDSIKNRIEESYYPQILNAIKKTDSAVSGESAMNPEKAAGYEEKYDRIRREIPPSYVSLKTEQLRKLCYDRIDQLKVFNVRYYDAAGLKCYETEEFTKALSFFREADNRSGLIRDEKIRNEEKAASSRNLKSAEINGVNFLNSRAYYLIDIAMVENGNRNFSTAKNIMKKAETLIKANSEFMTRKLKEDYNNAAMAVKVPSL